MSRLRDDLFPGRSEVAGLMRAKDWGATQLGEPETWPASLRAVIRVLLTSRFAMWLGWGPDLAFLYNDAYARMTLGAKHPWALGRPSHEVWAEIWSEIQPRVSQVMQSGEATWDERLLLFLERHGYPEETYHTFSYSPVTDDLGAVSALLCVVTEETERVVGERRLGMLRQTASRIATTNVEADLFEAVREMLETEPRDLPFALVYLFDHERRAARLVCRAGIAHDHPLAPATLDTGRSQSVWSLDEAFSGPGLVVDVSRRSPEIVAAPWGRAATRALVMPIAQQGQTRPAGIFVAGLSPVRPLDEGYRSFIDLFVSQLAGGIANTHAYEQERRRVDALAELDRAKTMFFSNVSHEFRTPLTLMMGPLEEMLARPDIDRRHDSRAALTMVQRNGQRLLKLVNTLLDFSRIEAGRVRARFEPTDLCEFTVDLASTFRSAMDRAGLAYRVDCHPLTEPVYVDRDMWEKVVLNLVSNAFKFTLTGGVTVSLTQSEGDVVLSVSDTGAGIPADELPRVFERFHRVEGAQGRSHEGSGIGLALVHELVKLHGGEITVQSAEGGGTRFTVSVPFGSGHLPAEQVVERSVGFSAKGAQVYVEEALRWLPSVPSGAAGGAVDPADTTEPPVAAGRVLVADDNADMRDYLQRLLSQRWMVEAVGDGRAALRAARERRPDVIVTDVMMPELDGFGLLKALRADPELQSIPVVMLSARAGEEARLEGLTASADDYLVKPFSARDLLVRVDAQLLKSRARAIEQRHSRRMTGLFTHSPVAIAVLRGPEHVYELVNSRYAEIIGGRSVVGKPIREGLPELEGQGIFELLDMVRRTGEPYFGKSLRVRLDRGPFGESEDAIFDFVYQPAFDDDGRVNSIVVVAHDVTEIATAKQEAESANRLKDEFLATLSHELRTPLNAVLGYTQMLRGGVVGPERVPTVLETIERNARLQEQLVSDVLDVSRIITGKLRLDVGPVDLPAVIRDALETVTPAAMAKGVRLQPVIDAPGVPVAGDAQRITQVVWNLLSNAVKFTPRGGRVQVRLQRVHSHVEIVVSDTGEGIVAEFMPHLFQRFTQADGTMTRTHSGLGLGLAISRHLVEAHGGRISAVSPGKGKGTTVRVELPLMIVHDPADAPARVHPTAELPQAAEFNRSELSGIRVLLVDDDVDALQMARDALTYSGARVATASSADDALSALDRERFDVAVLDIGMPDVDGYQLLQAIRERSPERQGRIPAAALTAYARTADRTRSLKAGFQMHLSKPVQPTELAAAVLALAGSQQR